MLSYGALDLVSQALVDDFPLPCTRLRFEALNTKLGALNLVPRALVDDFPLEQCTRVFFSRLEI